MLNWTEQIVGSRADHIGKCIDAAQNHLLEPIHCIIAIKL